MLLIIVVIIIVIIAGAWPISVYNRLVSKRNRVQEAYAEIDVQLKRRSSLIPNLVETVKGYAAHEKEVLEAVTNARASLMSAQGPQALAQADNSLTGTLKSLFAVAENYPDLKANENFQQLQDELSDTETKVAAAREYYNTNVLDYNTAIQVFPAVIIASMFHFTAQELFKATDEERADVKVQF